MKIRRFIWLEEFEEKIIGKHHVQLYEAEEAFFHEPAFRFMEPGQRSGENMYAVYGRTEDGRYLSIFFIYKLNLDALIVSARDMNNTERKLYEKRIH